MITGSSLISDRFWHNFLPIPAQNNLSIGSLAPEIQSKNIKDNREIKLSDYRHISPVILYFTRIFTEKHYCPLCYPHIQEMNRRYPEFQAQGVEVIMITSTDQSQSKMILGDLNIQMPLISDPNCSRFRRYGTGQALGAPLPAQFIVSPSGTIVYKHLFSFFEPNAPIDRLWQFL
jgi:peroxiredoxin